MGIKNRGLDRGNAGNLQGLGQYKFIQTAYLDRDALALTQTGAAMNAVAGQTYRQLGLLLLGGTILGTPQSVTVYYDAVNTFDASLTFIGYNQFGESIEETAVISEVVGAGARVVYQTLNAFARLVDVRINSGAGVGGVSFGFDPLDPAFPINYGLPARPLGSVGLTLAIPYTENDLMAVVDGGSTWLAIAGMSAQYSTVSFVPNAAGNICCLVYAPEGLHHRP